METYRRKGRSIDSIRWYRKKCKWKGKRSQEDVYVLCLWDEKQW